MSFKAKRAFSLLELIFVIFVGSLIVVYSSVYSKNYYETYALKQKLASVKLDLNSARIIIEKNLPSSKDELNFNENTLYFKGKVLLENIIFFEQNLSSTNILQIKLKHKAGIVQEWKFLL